MMMTEPSPTAMPEFRPPAVPHVLVRLDGFFAARSPAELGARTVALILLVTCLDVLTGPELAFSIFYLVPVGLAAWYMSWRATLLSVAAATAAWLLADVLAAAEYAHPLIRYWNALVRGSIFLVVGYTLAVLRGTLVEEQQNARTDPITGLPNWRAFQELAARELSRARRFHRPLTVAYLDLDDFKRVNDTWGHEAGNQLLRLVAQQLRHSLRLTDVVARIGGDEFVLLLPDCALTGAKVALEHAREVLGAGLEGWDVGFSIGAVSYLTPQPDDLDSMVRRADELMYRVKAAGKNTTTHEEV